MAAAHRQRETSRGHTDRPRGYLPSKREAPRGDYRAPGHRDNHRGGGRGRDGFSHRNSPPGRERDSGRRFDARGNSRDHRGTSGYRQSDEPDR